MATPLEFYFDFYSPYGYLASLKIEALAARYGRTVAWKPILLGPAFKASGAQPLLDTPMLGDYTRHDLQRTARLEGVELRFPPTFPGATLAAARAFYWLHDQNPAQAVDFAQRVYRHAFQEGEDITAPETVAQLAASVGADPEAVLQALTLDTVKQRLKTEIEQSLARNVFGSPLVIVDGEPFWGNDRLGQVEEWLHRGGW